MTSAANVSAARADAGWRGLRGRLGVTAGSANILGCEGDRGGCTTRLFMMVGQSRNVPASSPTPSKQRTVASSRTHLTLLTRKRAANALRARAGAEDAQCLRQAGARHALDTAARPAPVVQRQPLANR